MRLDGVRVLDLTRLLPGPYATQLLADAGADVVKIEDTDAGDYARHMPPLTDRGHGAVFDAVNRGKRSVAIDLKDEGGRLAFYDLASTADVVIESFRPGVTERLGVDYAAVREHSEDVVYCSLTGYGQNGPLADAAGHDLNYVGVAGLLDMTREDVDATPQPPGYQVADLGGGLFAAFAVVSALLSRELADGGGEYLDVSMTDVVASFSQSVAPEVFQGGDPRPGETALTGGFPWYDVYACADDGYVTLGALEPRFWRGFCEAVDRPDLIDVHMTQDPTERQALRAELDELFAERTRDEWVAFFEDADATVEGVYTPAEALEHPQIEAREIVKREEGVPPRVGFPARGSDVPAASGGDVPAHGEHTDVLLSEAGMDEDRIGQLREAGVVA